MAEFFIGTPALIAFGVYVAVAQNWILGDYFVLTGLNYAPVVLYTVVIVRARTWKSEVAEEMASDPHYVRKYSVQQFLIFVPFSIIILAIVQELEKPTRSQTTS